jgi:hypothetical protein
MFIIVCKRHKIRILKGTSRGLYTHGRLLSTLMNTIIALTTIHGNACTSVTVSNKRTILTMISRFQ